MKSIIKDYKNVVAASWKFTKDHWFSVVILNIILTIVYYVVFFTDIPNHIAKFIKSLFKKSHK